jgi:hypothetical protein
MYENHLIYMGGMKRTITLSKQINRFILSILQLPLYICLFVLEIYLKLNLQLN